MQTTNDARVQRIRAWLAGPAGFAATRLELASADASFRRYFRVWRADGATRIVMDAPPDKEDVGQYIKVTRLLSECGVHVPSIDAADPALGLLLLEDLGSTSLLAELIAGGDAECLYGDCLDALARIQLRGGDAIGQVPPYDAALLEQEMNLLPEWFCRRHLRRERNMEEDGALLMETFDLLVREVLEQPVVLVHRDYHSRNLMLTGVRSPGIIDFQDAVGGPIAYDLVSLLKDCYISYPRETVLTWVERYRQRLISSGFAVKVDEREFVRWFDLVGVQRHIKVLGIFARLWYRDGKSGYLADLPRVLAYILEASALYPALQPLRAWLERVVVPALPAANARELAAGPS